MVFDVFLWTLVPTFFPQNPHSIQWKRVAGGLMQKPCDNGEGPRSFWVCSFFHHASLRRSVSKHHLLPDVSNPIGMSRWPPYP